MADRPLGMVTWMLAGYLAGLTIGFAAFDPNTDLYALLGAVMAIAGLLLGLTPPFRRAAHLALGAIIGIGFYFGAVAGILLFGTPATDDLREVAEHGGMLLVALVGTVAGVFLVYRLSNRLNRLLAAVFLFGGFFGGLLLSAVGIAPRTAMVGLAPYVIACGALCAALVAFLGRRFRGRLSAA